MQKYKKNFIANAFFHQFNKKDVPLQLFLKHIIMASITLEYDFRNTQAQRTLEYILSLGLFKPALVNREETLSEKREKLDNELKHYLVDLSSFKFNREEANI